MLSPSQRRSDSILEISRNEDISIQRVCVKFVSKSFKRMTEMNITCNVTDEDASDQKDCSKIHIKFIF